MKASAAFILLAAGIAVAVASRNGQLAALSPAWAAAAFSATVMHFAFEPMRWQLYLGRGDTRRGLMFYHVFSATALLSYMLPAKLGLPLRFWLLSRDASMSRPAVAAGMAVDSALSMLVWTCATVAVGGSIVPLLRFPSGSVLAALLITACVCMAALFWLRKPLVRYTKRAREVLREAAREIGIASLGLAALLVAVDIAVYVVRHAAILCALGASFPGWHAVAAATVLAIYAGFVCMLPMGLVGYDATIVLLLTQSGVPVETAALVPLINRSANILAGILVGVPSLARLGLGMNPKSILARLNQGPDGQARH